MLNHGVRLAFFLYFLSLKSLIVHWVLTIVGNRGIWMLKESMADGWIVTATQADVAQIWPILRLASLQPAKHQLFIHQITFGVSWVKLLPVTSCWFLLSFRRLWGHSCRSESWCWLQTLQLRWQLCPRLLIYLSLQDLLYPAFVFDELVIYNIAGLVDFRIKVASWLHLVKSLVRTGQALSSYRLTLSHRSLLVSWDAFFVKN